MRGHGGYPGGHLHPPSRSSPPLLGPGRCQAFGVGRRDVSRSWPAVVEPPRAGRCGVIVLQPPSGSAPGKSASLSAGGVHSRAEVAQAEGEAPSLCRKGVQVVEVGHRHCKTRARCARTYARHQGGQHRDSLSQISWPELEPLLAHALGDILHINHWAACPEAPRLAHPAHPALAVVKVPCPRSRPPREDHVANGWARWEYVLATTNSGRVRRAQHGRVRSVLATFSPKMYMPLTCRR